MPEAQALSGDHDGLRAEPPARPGPVRRRVHPRAPSWVLGPARQRGDFRKRVATAHEARPAGHQDASQGAHRHGARRELPCNGVAHGCHDSRRLDSGCHVGAVACAPRRGGALRGVADAAIVWCHRGRSSSISFSASSAVNFDTLRCSPRVDDLHGIPPGVVLASIRAADGASRWRRPTSCSPDRSPRGRIRALVVAAER
jgi:hypothetical protein